MSDSDQKRRDYLWSTMNIGERSSELRRMLIDVQRRLDEIDNPGRTHFVGDDCAGGHRHAFDGSYISTQTIARWRRIEEAAKTVVATIDSCKGWSEYHVTFASLREALKS